MRILNFIFLIFMLLTCLITLAEPTNPIHHGRFYSSRDSQVIDTLFLPVDQQYTVKFSVYRHVDSVEMIDNQKYRFSVSNLSSDPKYSKLQQYPDDWMLYNYMVLDYKAIIPMYISIYIQTDSISDLFKKKPIDVLFYTSTTLSDNCYELYQASNKTSVGLDMLKYVTLFKFYLKQKIEKEITIVAKESGDLLMDDVYIVILPCKDVIRIKEGNSSLFESQN